jgi:acyl dehydratase
MTPGGQQTTELESAPSLRRLYAQALVAPMVPGADAELPERRLVLREARVDPERVADYARVCGFTVRNSAPATFPHLLAFPLHLSLMTDRSFPFSVLGLVHIANRIDALAPIPVGERLEVALRAEDLRPHRRGRQFDLVAEARLGDLLAWRGRSTYLHRENERSSSDAPAARAGEDGDGGLQVSAEWTIPGDIGRRYAAVSGDRNPIHMHPLSARLFGFPTPIAHGMWTKARCLAAFEGRTADAFAIEAEFKAPLRIPGRARLLTGRREDGWAFRVEALDGARTHLVGAIS